MSCKKDDKVIADVPEVVVGRQEYNIGYGSDPFQKMDIYFPPGYSKLTPVVFMVHGGGFVAGLKEDFAPQSVMFRDQGFVVVNLTYRLVDTVGMFTPVPTHKKSTVTIAEQLEDLRLAVKTYVRFAPKFGTGTDRMYMAGASAGGILSMLYAHSSLNSDGLIKACGNWCGSVDLTIPNDDAVKLGGPQFAELYYRATGAMPGPESNKIYEQFSPYFVVANRGVATVPNISILPENTTVYSNIYDLGFGVQPTRRFHELLAKNGVREKLDVYPGEVHTFSNSPDSWQKLIAETATFFKDIENGKNGH